MTWDSSDGWDGLGSGGAGGTVWHTQDLSGAMDNDPSSQFVSVVDAGSGFYTFTVNDTVAVCDDVKTLIAKSLVTPPELTDWDTQALLSRITMFDASISGSKLVAGVGVVDNTPATATGGCAVGYVESGGNIYPVQFGTSNLGFNQFLTLAAKTFDGWIKTLGEVAGTWYGGIGAIAMRDATPRSYSRADTFGLTGTPQPAFFFGRNSPTASSGNVSFTVKIELAAG